MNQDRLYHISENGSIKTFYPRPSPSVFEAIKRDVVFAVSGKLLHNYLFPRDCPRVTYYTTPRTSEADKKKLMGDISAKFIITVETKWVPVILQTILYCYEFPAENFVLLDECAGYYISYQLIEPLSVTRIENPLEELLSRNDIELLTLPSLHPLADAVAKSSLNFSLIRMRNAIKREDEIYR